MTALQNILNFANRIMEEPIFYQSRTNKPILIRATKESTDAIPSISENYPQSWRVVGFSMNTADLKNNSGEAFLPRKGDTIADGNGKVYKVIEQGGVAWIDRFTNSHDRIMVFAEQE